MNRGRIVRVVFTLVVALGASLPLRANAIYSLQCDLKPQESTFPAFDLAAIFAGNADDVTPMAPITRLESSVASVPEWDHLARELLHVIGGDDLNASFGFLPVVRFEPNALPNAFATERGEVVLSMGLIALLDSRSEFAFVIAHEVGHLLLGHAHSEPGMGPEGLETAIARELEADKFALGLLEKAGIELKGAGEFLSRLGEHGAERGYPLKRVFPSLSPRINALEGYLVTKLQRLTPPA